MAVCKAVEVMYQNQMQFNLDVPLAASNIASHYHHPGPIMVERVGGQSTIPGRSYANVPSSKNQNVSGSSSFCYSVISEDTMSKVSQLAKRDLKNRRLQVQKSREKSPSAESIATRRHQPQACTRQRRPQGNKPRIPLRAKEADRNRRVGNVQTPPPRKARSFHNHLGGDTSFYSNTTGDGEDSRDSDSFFPIKPPVKANTIAGPKDEFGKLQSEMESYLQMLCRIERQVLRDGNTEFLQHRVKGKVKDNFLVEEENMDRVRVRAGEHNTRSARNLYNLSQKVKQLQRDVTQADFSKPTKKSQIMAQLNATYRGGVRALQMFVNQLPYQDLHMGLPSSYNELALLIRQLTTLMTLTQQGASVESPDSVLSLLDQVDDFHSKWCTMALQSNSRSQSPLRRTAVNHAAQKEWVSDTKVDGDLFSKNVTNVIAKRLASKKKENVGTGHKVIKQRWVEEGKPRRGGTSGKENKMTSSKEDSKRTAAKPSLTGQKSFGFVTVEPKASQSSKSVYKDIDVGKGYLLPPDLLEKRERAQRAVEFSNKNFADPTHSSRLKTSSRPQSAPSPVRKKEVNFDLREDRKSPLPWIPAGYAPCKPRPRSSSAERAPFYVHSIDGNSIWAAKDDDTDRYSRSGAGEDRQRQPSFGHRSLPTERQLRSCDVSDSFVDLIEKRIMYRMFQAKNGVRDVQLNKDQILYSSNDALDITDLTVEKSYEDQSLNTTAEAASLMDAPTLENIRLKLTEMERTRREIRQRWSSLRFIDMQQKARTLTNGCPEYPGVIDLSSLPKDGHPSKSLSTAPINKDWVEEPVLFTKSTTQRQYHAHMVTNSQSANPEDRQMVSLNRDTLDRILEDKDKLDDNRRKQSYHPTGKFDPWTLVEQISEAILTDCLQEVSEEVEKASEEIANQMYKSEFMVTGRPSESKVLDLSNNIKPNYRIDLSVHSVTSGHVGLEEDELAGPDYNGGQPFIMDEESPRSPVSGNGFELLGGVPSEPLLDNVSQLVQEKVEGLVETADGSGSTDEKDNDNEDNNDEDGEDDYEDDDDDDDDYSDDEFEDVSDVEL